MSTINLFFKIQALPTFETPSSYFFPNYHMNSLRSGFSEQNVKSGLMYCTAKTGLLLLSLTY